MFTFLSSCSGAAAISATSLPYGLVPPNNSQLLNYIYVYLSAVAIVAMILLYFYQRWSTRRDSCHAIMSEIDENKYVLTSNYYQRITYKSGRNTSKQQQVRYTNAYLDLDGYQSVVHSGVFTQFKADTQHKLTLLYGRIRNRNELITYRDHFQDMFFIHDDGSKERLDRWYKEVERYDFLITKLESQIMVLLNVVEEIMEKESKRLW